MSHQTTRRTFLKTTAAAAAASALPDWARAAGAGRKPNIVLIMADDLGYEGLSCYGATSYKTPVLDELARTGIRFSHCYAQPLCTPSRVQIMTGRYNFRNYTQFGMLEPKERTFAHMLKAAGYATCAVGKWQLWRKGKGTLPEQAGFDDHCLWQVKTKGRRYWHPRIQVNGKLHKEMTAKYGPDVFADHACAFIEKNKDRPFFLYYPMVLTHSPFPPTPDSGVTPPTPERAGKNGKGGSDKKYFVDMVAYTDKMVGRIVKKLDALGLRENTLILFTGDNGSPRNITTKMHNGQIRGGKGNTNDAGTRVALVANWSGAIPAGRVCEDLVDFSDFMPTLAEVGGGKPPAGVTLDGRSFLPQLRGQTGNPREWVLCHYDPKWGKWKFSRSARDKRYRLYHDGRLFDTVQDVLEKKPIPAGQGSAEAEAARRKLQKVLDTIK